MLGQSYHQNKNYKMSQVFAIGLWSMMLVFLSLWHGKCVNYMIKWLFSLNSKLDAGLSHTRFKFSHICTLVAIFYQFLTKNKRELYALISDQFSAPLPLRSYRMCMWTEIWSIPILYQRNLYLTLFAQIRM